MNLQQKPPQNSFKSLEVCDYAANPVRVISPFHRSPRLASMHPSSVKSRRAAGTADDDRHLVLGATAGRRTCSKVRGVIKIREGAKRLPPAEKIAYRLKVKFPSNPKYRIAPTTLAKQIQRALEFNMQLQPIIDEQSIIDPGRPIATLK
jgi:hypothetical protein